MLTWHRTQYGQKNSLWRRYTQRKNSWIATHPDATPSEIEKAAREIADALGL